MSINKVIYSQIAMEKKHHQRNSNRLSMINKKNELFLETLDVIDKVFDRYIKNLKIEDFRDEEHFNIAKYNLGVWKDNFWTDIKPNTVNECTVDDFTDELNSQIKMQKNCN